MKKTITTTTPNDGENKQKKDILSKPQPDIIPETKPEILTTLKATDDQESKEKLEAMPMYIIYRENDLYASLMPRILETLQQLGRKVVVHVFPAMTSEEEIQRYLAQDDVKESLQNVGFLRDYTCSKQLPGKSYNFDKENNTKGYGLESLANRII